MVIAETRIKAQVVTFVDGRRSLSVDKVTLTVSRLRETITESVCLAIGQIRQNQEGVGTVGSPFQTEIGGEVVTFPLGNRSIVAIGALLAQEGLRGTLHTRIVV